MSENSSSSGSIATARPFFEHFLRIVCISEELLDAFTSGRCQNDDSGEVLSDIIFRVVMLPMDGSIIRLQLLGLGLQGRFRNFDPQHFRAAHGVIVGYDSSDAEAPNYLRSVTKDMAFYLGKNVVKAFVSYSPHPPKRAVLEEVLQIATEEKALPFQSSPNNRDSTDQVFFEVARNIIALKQGGDVVSKQSSIFLSSDSIGSPPSTNSLMTNSNLTGGERGERGGRNRDRSASISKIKDWLRSPKPGRRKDSPPSSSSSTSPTSPVTSPRSYAPSPLSSPKGNSPPFIPTSPTHATSIQIKQISTLPDPLIPNARPNQYSLFRHQTPDTIETLLDLSKLSDDTPPGGSGGSISASPTVASPPLSPKTPSPSQSPMVSRSPSEEMSFSIMKEREKVKRQERGERLMMVGLQRAYSNLSTIEPPTTSLQPPTPPSSSPIPTSTPTTTTPPIPIATITQIMPFPMSPSPSPTTSTTLTTTTTATTATLTTTQSANDATPNPPLGSDPLGIDLIDAFIAGNLDFATVVSLSSATQPSEETPTR